MSGGYANLLTGAVHLLDVPASALSKYLVRNRLPQAFLTSFLHESTHFWCMATDFGAAIALTEMRAHRDIIASKGESDRLLHDHGVVQLAHQLMRPLLEGMALFQEFDAYPGSSNVVSTPAFWAALLFQPLEEPPPPKESQDATQWMMKRITGVLGRYRTSDVARRRKTSILMRSLSQDPNSYLAGYLSVKNIWMNAVQSTDAFLDTDLFLTFFRDWIFQDWKLIDYFIDDSLSTGAVAYLAPERLQERILTLATTNLSEEVAAYDAEVGSGRRDQEILMKSLRVEEWEARDSQRRLGEPMQRFIKEPPRMGSTRGCSRPICSPWSTVRR